MCVVSILKSNCSFKLINSFAKFALVIDVCSINFTHCVGFCCSSLLKNDMRNKSALLIFKPSLKRKLMDLDNHFEFMEYTLYLYEKALSNIVAIIGDNGELNERVSN